MRSFKYPRHLFYTFTLSLFVMMSTSTIEAATWADGVYTGTGKGFNGPVAVEVIVDEGEIRSIVITDHQETPFIGDAGLAVTDEIVASQSLDVATVSGATVSSRAAIEAVKDALNSATGWSDGVFRGEGQGYNGMILVEVIVLEGKITTIDIVSHTETPFISDAAFEGITTSIVNQQVIDVDIVTGATLTSTGIMSAVKNALG